MQIFSRTYGVELECLFPARCNGYTVAQALTDAGVPCSYAGYSHQNNRNWKVVTDGSVHGTGLTGLEIVSPPLSGEAGLAQIEKVSVALLALGATVNKSCGLHVHVDARNMPVPAMRKLAAVYAENETVLDTLMPNSRRASNNQYCKTLTQLNPTRLAQADSANGVASAINGGCRYAKVNFTAYWRHGTVEFRHHSGTVEHGKINNWVKACLRMVCLAVAEANQPINMARTNRPRNARMARIYDLMNRPNGATREEVAVMLGRSTMPPLRKILTQHGIAFRAERTGLGERYYLAEAVTTAATVRPTLASLCDRLQMEVSEKEFWAARAAALATDSSTGVARRSA